MDAISGIAILIMLLLGLSDAGAADATPDDDTSDTSDDATPPPENTTAPDQPTMMPDATPGPDNTPPPDTNPGPDMTDTIENTLFFGTPNPDTIDPETNRSVGILGRGDDDTLIGGDADDVLVGDKGADTLFGNGGPDALIGAFDTSFAFEEFDTFLRDEFNTSTEELLAIDDLTGHPLQQSLDVNTGRQAVIRLAALTAIERGLVQPDMGADRLEGGPGDDILSLGEGDPGSGGAGEDTFDITLFFDPQDESEAPFDPIAIEDFNPTEDEIVVSLYGRSGEGYSNATAVIPDLDVEIERDDSTNTVEVFTVDGEIRELVGRVTLENGLNLSDFTTPQLMARVVI
jgi:Ca2+-binding RTX toxin-like protein